MERDEPSPAALGWMATLYLCQSLAEALGELGAALRDARAYEAPVGE
jgi:hypothetical protein